MFTSVLTSAAAKGKATGVVVVLVDGRSITGELASFSQWTEALDGRFPGLLPDKTKTAYQDDKGELFLRNARDADGAIGWLAIKVDTIQAIGFSD